MAMEQCGDELSTDSTTTIGELDVLPPTPEMSSLSHETSPPKSIIKDLYIISPIQANEPLTTPFPAQGAHHHFWKSYPHTSFHQPKSSSPSPNPSSQTQEKPFTITYPDIPSQCSDSLSHFCSAALAITSHLPHSRSSTSTSLKRNYQSKSANISQSGLGRRSQG